MTKIQIINSKLISCCLFLICSNAGFVALCFILLAIKTIIESVFLLVFDPTASIYLKPLYFFSLICLAILYILFLLYLKKRLIRQQKIIVTDTVSTFVDDDKQYSFPLDTIVEIAISSDFKVHHLFGPELVEYCLKIKYKKSDNIIEKSFNISTFTDRNYILEVFSRCGIKAERVYRSKYEIILEKLIVRRLISILLIGGAAFSSLVSILVLYLSFQLLFR